MDDAPRGPQPTLLGARVLLRPWRAEDAPAVSAACQDAEVQRWTTVPVPYRLEHAEHFVGEVAGDTWAAGGALFAVEALSDGGLVGSMGLHHVQDGVATAGYWTVAGRRGQGLTAEALRVLADWAFDVLGVRRVELIADPANTGSNRVAGRAGFSAEGVLRSRYLHRGVPGDVVLWSMLAADRTQMTADAGGRDSTVDLEADPGRAAAACTGAHARLLAHVSLLDDADVRRASRLPGWSVGHVLTHLARNADAHARRLTGALRGEDVGKYPGGAAQRERDIEEGAGRPATELVQDLALSQQRLDQLFTECAAAGWPGSRLMGGSHYPATGCPAHRLREVEVHHVDLDIGYTPADWPAEYVAWELPGLLATVPDRLRSREDRAAVLAWLAGRGSSPADVELEPW